ncbi:hypothetical protein M5C99_12465 [Acidovorax sp. NCPPB 2350]|nr:hypothetical protein M5C99_12465 [Acidovorax sp. NCPPB 2350]
MMHPPISPQSQDRSHLLTQEILPWIVNGRASEEQRANAQRHLDECADCRTELALQERIHAAMQIQSQQATPDVDAGLKALMQRIELDALCDQPAPRATPAAAPRRRFGRATYALAAIALLQTAALALVGHRMAVEQDASPYQTLSSPSQAVAAHDALARSTIRVVPDGQTTLADWNAALTTLGLQVVSGPNAMGAYAVMASPGTSGEQVVERLRATPGMRLVEPMGSAP